MKSKLFHIITLSLLGVTIGLASCENQQEDTQVNTTTSNLDGKTLMENNCYSCHNTQGTDNMLAPPMQRVKDHYLDENTTKNDFIQSIVDWCENPTEEKSRMPGARNKFGLMPKQEFDSDEVRAIADYLYDNDLDHLV